jgi:hypothetical protein
MRTYIGFGRRLAVALALGTLLPLCAFASWEDHGNPVCTETGQQQYPDVIPDGAGGAILVWEDNRGLDTDIYAQRVNPSGVVLWTPTGVPICTTGGRQMVPEIAPDGVGGAFIVWEDRRVPAGDIYAQRVDASGAVLWPTNGVPVCTTDASQIKPDIDADGSGGSVIAWQDFRGAGDTGWEIYAQRLTASGTALWTPDGVAASTAWGTQWYPEIIRDGAGGAIITWADRRNWNSDIFVQRIDASGTVLWATDGATVCIDPEDQRYPVIVPDGAGGAILAWTDYEDGDADPNIFAQRVNASGTMLWADCGVSVCSAPNSQIEVAIAPDENGGAIATWYDKRNGVDYNIYAQRIDTLGAPVWTVDGVPVCTAVSNQEWPVIVADGAGGAVIAWHDLRFNNYDVFGQRVDSLGTVLWTADGVSMCTASGNQRLPSVTTDGNGGALVAWFDGRGSSEDIYAQRVSADGCSGPTALSFASVAIAAANGQVNLSWQMGIEVSAGDFIVQRSESPEGPFLNLTVPILEGEGRSFSCTDSGVIQGRRYWYRIALLSFSGAEYYGPVEVYVSPAPIAYRVFQSYPNPFNPTCMIRYEIPMAGAVRLRVFDASGAIVRTLVDAWTESGSYSRMWDGRDQIGREAPSGVYFYRLEAGGLELTRKAVLLR